MSSPVTNATNNITNITNEVGERAYKIIIVGGSKSGKTSFFRRWIYDEFLSSHRYIVSFF